MVKPSSLSKKSKGRGKSSPGITSAALAESTAAPRETEGKILAAARQEFIAKGLVGARMHVIAADAGVNKALLHYYYRSKERLYQTVLHDILQSVWGKLQEEFRSQGEIEGLEPLVRILVSTYVRILAANPEFPVFMIREVSSGGNAMPPVIKEILKNFGDVPVRIFQALQAEIKAGKIKPVNPMHFLLNLMGMCVVSFIALPVIRKVAPELGIKVDLGENFLEDRIAAILDMVFHGIRSRK
jgi:TetR/AcrR family transcriptional regulator